MSTLLEKIRQSLRAESISYLEICQLQDLYDRGLIPENDIELLEAAGVPENL